MNEKSKIVLFLIAILLTSSFTFPAISETLETEAIDENSTEPTRSLANSPWPCFGGNAQHTGLSKYDTSDNPGKQKWKFKTDDYVFSAPVIGSDGTIYFGFEDYNLYAVNRNGTLKWKFNTGNSVTSSPAIDSDGIIYVSSIDGYLYAIKPNGYQKWKFKTGSGGDSSPVIGSDGTIYVGSRDKNVYAIYPDGSLKWKFETEEDIHSSPAISTNGTIYIGSGYYGGYIYAITPNGKLKWKFNTGYIDSTPAIGSDGTIYISSKDDHIYAIHPNGTLKWKYNTGGDTESSPAIGSDGTIYVGSWDDHLYAINFDGTEKWKFKTGGNIDSSPAIGSDGTIYVGSWDDHLYAINIDGTEKWKFKTGLYVKSSPAIGSDGTIYIGSHDEYLYAIGKVPPLPPRNLQTTEGDGYIDLTWEASIDDGGTTITGYKIYRNVSFGEKSILTTIDSTLTSYRDDNVEVGQLYIYYVSAINNIGESNHSLKSRIIYKKGEPSIYLKDNDGDVLDEENSMVGGYPNIDLTDIKLWINEDYLLFEMSVKGEIQSAMLNSNLYDYGLDFFMNKTDNPANYMDSEFVLFYSLGKADIENMVTEEKHAIEALIVGNSTLRFFIPISFIDNNTDFKITAWSIYYFGVKTGDPIFDYDPFSKRWDESYTDSSLDAENIIGFNNPEMPENNRITILLIVLSIIIFIIIINLIFIFLSIHRKKKKEVNNKATKLDSSEQTLEVEPLTDEDNEDEDEKENSIIKPSNTFCTQCGIKIMVTNPKRPITIICPDCGNEYILKADNKEKPKIPERKMKKNLRN